MINLCEFRQRKTLGAPSPTLMGQCWNFGPSAMSANVFAPDPGPFAFFVELQPLIIAWVLDFLQA